MNGRTPPPAEAPAAPSKSQLEERRDLQGLLALHEEIVLGQGGVVVLEGPRGVGKAALLGQLRRELAAKGRLVLFGRAEQTATSPYACLHEPAAQALAFLESRGLAETFLEQHAAALGLLLPNLQAPITSTRSQDKTGFFEALRAFFLDLAKVSTPSLLLADVHYADDDTRDLIRFLAAHLFHPEAPGGDPAVGFQGALMLACRTDDDEGARVVEELQSGAERFRTFSVAGLNRQELVQYLAEHPALERLLAASGGRPEEIDELLDALPSDTDSLLLERVRSLDEGAQACLKALAVVGRPSPPDVVAAVLSRPVAEVAPQLSSLVERRLLARRLSNGELLFTFARAHHPEVLRAHLGGEERRRLHHQIGLALEGRAAGESIDQLLAYHFLEGAEAARGVPYALAASERLLVTFAYGSAAALVTRALPHADGDEQRFSLLSQLTEAEKARGNLPRALEAAQKMKELAPPAQLPAVLRRIGELLAGRGDHKAALEMLEQALALDEGGDPAEHSADGVLPERAQVLAAISEVAYRKGDHEAAERRAAEALRAAPNAPVAFRLRAANALAKVAYSRQRYEEAERLFLENLTLAEANELDYEGMQARVNTGISRFHMGRYDEAREILERALGQARAVADISFEAQALLNLGAICQRENDLGRAIRYFTGALALFSRMGRRLQLRLTTWNLANVFIAVGMHDKARAYLEQSRRFAELEDSDRGRAFVHFSEGDIASDEGQYGVALTSFEGARALFGRVGERAREVEMVVKGAWAALLLGDLDAARRRTSELERVDPEAPLQAARMRAVRGAVLAAAAEVADAEDAAEGMALLAQGIDELERLAADDDSWRALAFLAARYEAQGDERSAEAARGRARAVVARFGERLPKDLYKSFLDHVVRGQLSTDEERRRRGLDVSLTDEAPIDDEEAEGDAEDARGSEGSEEEVRTRAPLTLAAPASRRAEWDERYPEIVGEGPTLLRVFDRLDRIARTSQARVLIRGESGTGKELVAAAIHRMSERRTGPFVRVNCAALVETLLLSELFGHEKGSFTGAFARKVGRFELARGGTIFLDEIGDISPKTQVSLLRVLQEKSFERVGGTQTIQTDAVVICATHRDLEAMVREGSFREDLYYRLRGVVVEVPALRDRVEDIPRLAHTFLEVARKELGRAPSKIARDAEEVLCRYGWPGNIRELQNVVRSVALFCEGDVVAIEHLAEFPELFDERAGLRRSPAARPVSAAPAPAPPLPAAPPPPPPAVPSAHSSSTHSASSGSTADVLRRVEREQEDEGLALGDLKRKLEFEAIANAMRQTAGNVTKAAKLLKMKRPRLSQIVNGNPELKAIKEASRAGRSLSES